MRSRAALIGLGLAAAAAVVAVWFALGRDSISRSAAAPARALDRASRAVEPPPPIELGDAAPRIAERVAEIDERSARKDRWTPPPPGSGPQVILRGKILSSRTDLALAEVTVWFDENDAQFVTVGGSEQRVSPPRRANNEQSVLRASVGADGTFELDVSAIATATYGLEVTATHPRLVKASKLVSTKPVRAAKRGECVELPVVLKMLDTICLVRGNVVHRTASKAMRSIAAFEMHGLGLASSATAHYQTRDEGRFELELNSTRDYALVAFAQDLRPETVRVSCAGKETIELGAIALDAGLSISGQVLLGTAPFGAGMTVQAELERPVAVTSLGNANFVWTGDAFEWSRRNAGTNDLGQYELTALGRSKYSLRVTGARGVYLHDVEPLSLYAPAIDADIAPRVCEVQLSFFDHGEPAATTSFMVRNNRDGPGLHFGGYSSDSSGHAKLWLPPEGGTEVVVGHATENERVFPVFGCAADESVELRIDL